MKRFYFQLALFIFPVIFITKVNSQNIPWKNIGPFMGYINCMAMDTLRADTVYAGTPTGIYKSEDGAENWFKTSLNDVEINCLTISQNNPGLLIASSDSIVYKSDDFGETWNENWKSEITIGAIAIDPENDLSIWVGIDVGWSDNIENLYHSGDGGETWEAVPWDKEDENRKLNSIISIHFDRSNESIIYVCGYGNFEGSDQGLFVSSDKGESWKNHKLGGCSNSHGLAVSSTPKGYEPHTAFVLVEACSIAEKLFKSLDYGNTWTEIDMPETDYIGGNPRVMEIDPVNPEWLNFGGNYKSEASIVAFNIEAETWHYYPGTPFSYPSSLLMNSTIWYMGFKRDGVFRWDDDKDTAFVAKIAGMTDMKVYDIMTYPDNQNKTLAAIEGSLAKTNNGGETWDLIDKSFGALALHPKDTSMIYAGVVSSYLPNPVDSYYGYKSMNGGDSWSGYKLFTRGGLAEYGYTFRTGDILISPDDPEIILFGVDGGGGAGEGLFRNINGGDSWTREFSTGVSPIAMDPGNHDILYLGTTKSGSVHRSEDGGQSWNPIGGQADIISDLGVDINGQVMAATSEGLLIWDGSETWSVVPAFEDIYTKAIVIDNRPALPVYYVGTEKQGVFVSADGGTTWDSFNEGLKKSNITRLRLTDSNPRNLYAGTEDGGVWVTTLKKETTAVSILHNPEISFNIFPNPNNGTFNIITDCNSELKGNLKIINFLGEIIYLNSNVRIGSKKAYEISIDKVTPGNYVLTFTDDKLMINRKVIFVK